MKLKKMSDEFIQLDVEKINGYLSAVETLNAVDQVGVDYKFIRLSEKETLLKSIESNITELHPKTILENWHIRLESVNEEQFVDSVNVWFFRFGSASMLCDRLDSLTIGFRDVLQTLVYSPNIYRVNMIPPIWYATHWETFAFDCENGFFVLEFLFDS